jgi:hypothetical protein
MSNASNLEVITSVQRRRRWAVEEKISWVRRSMGNLSRTAFLRQVDN